MQLKFRFVWDFNPLPLRYQCSAHTTWAKQANWERRVIVWSRTVRVNDSAGVIREKLSFLRALFLKNKRETSEKKCRAMFSYYVEGYMHKFG